MVLIPMCPNKQPQFIACIHVTNYETSQEIFCYIIRSVHYYDNKLTLIIANDLSCKQNAILIDKNRLAPYIMTLPNNGKSCMIFGSNIFVNGTKFCYFFGSRQ